MRTILSKSYKYFAVAGLFLFAFCIVGNGRIADCLAQIVNLDKQLTIGASISNGIQWFLLFGAAYGAQRYIQQLNVKKE